MKNLSIVSPCDTTGYPQPIGKLNSCRYGGGYFEVSDRGVYFVGKDKEGQEQSPKWICTSLRVVAKTRDERSNEWGCLLEWQDCDGKIHQWAMPLELLESDGADVRRELARRGLQISPGLNERNLLAAYIKTWPVKTRGRCVERLGWHGSVYVTPSGTIGTSDELMVYQSAHAVQPAFSESGTSEEWIDSVAFLAQGNSRLVFAIALAFAGPLAEIAGEDSGGFHFRGASSSGKSTALNVAASVWGRPVQYIRLWRVTSNGLEGLAVMHNNNLLILDEISQIDPTSAGDAAYLLANGQGKTRAQRNGMARASQHWNLLFLSAGEESLSTITTRAGKRATAGQEIRLADIEADAGARMGMFEELHDVPSAAIFAARIKEVANKNFGTVGTAWLNHLVINQTHLQTSISAEVKSFVQSVVPAGAAGQVERVARRFALVAVAGELATRCELTGWRKGEANQAAAKCFAAWLDAFGGIGNHESRAIVSQLRAFLETHGASRFENFDSVDEQRIPNRAGFYRDVAGRDREFLILTETFRRDICQGFDEKTVKKVLIDCGLLAPGKNGQPTQSMRLPSLGPTRVYSITFNGESQKFE